jgi:hypothetical protein
LRTDLNTECIETWFVRLATCLKYRLLPTERQGKREANASEFMLMYTSDDGREAFFKHVDTRNYLSVKRDIDGDYYIKIPDDGKSFHKGFFDTFDKGQSADLK